MVNLPLHYLSYNGNTVYCTDYMVYIPLCVCSYSVMRQCWEADCSKRPSFSHLRTTFTAMLSNAQNATYINLNVDEMLPCYSMNTEVEDEACELTDRDLQPSLIGVREGEAGSTNGYQTLEAGACSDRDDDDSIPGGYRSVEGRGDDSSIASDDVVVLGAAGVAAIGPCGVASNL